LFIRSEFLLMLKKTWMAKTKKAELGLYSKLGAMPKLDLFFGSIRTSFKVERNLDQTKK
jgi:hypothetical protein